MPRPMLRSMVNASGTLVLQRPEDGSRIPVAVDDAVTAILEDRWPAVEPPRSGLSYTSGEADDWVRMGWRPSLEYFLASEAEQPPPARGAFDAQPRPVPARRGLGSRVRWDAGSALPVVVASGTRLLLERRTRRRFPPGVRLSKNGLLSYLEHARRALKDAFRADELRGLRYRLVSYRVGDLEEADWHLDLDVRELHLAHAGAFEDQIVDLLCGMQAPRTASFTLVITCDLDLRRAAFPHERALRDLYVEVGRLAQWFIITAEAVGLGGLITPATNDDALSSLLGLEKGVVPVYTLTLGPKAHFVTGNQHVEAGPESRGTRPAGRRNPGLPEGWSYQRFESPLVPGATGAAVYEEDAVLGAAWDIDPARARIRALGEAVERAALFAEPTEVISGTARALGERHRLLDLDSAYRYSPAQLADERLAAYRWDTGTRTGWVEATHADGGAVLVPADLAYLRRTSRDATTLRPAISVGTACAADIREACRRACLEILERHRVTIALSGGRPVPALDAAGAVAEIEGPLSGAGFELRVGIVHDEGPGQVAIAAIRHGDGRPGVAVGMGAGFGTAPAARSAALEALQILHLQEQLRRRRPEVSAEIRTAHDRARWWGAADGGLLDLIISPETAPAPAAERETAPGDLLSSLQSISEPVAWLEITPAWAPEGFRVVRVVAPAFLWLAPDGGVPLRRSHLLPQNGAAHDGLVAGRFPHPFA